MLSESEDREGVGFRAAISYGTGLKTDFRRRGGREKMGSC
jgi:hypothetical protein